MSASCVDRMTIACDTCSFELATSRFSWDAHLKMHGGECKCLSISIPPCKGRMHERNGVIRLMTEKKP